MATSPQATSFAEVTRNRHEIRHRNLGVDIAGVAIKWEERSPALEAHGQNYVNKLHAADIGIQVTARAETKAARNAAQRVENFCHELYEQFHRSRSGQMYWPDRRAIDQQTFYGVGIYRLGFANDVREKLGRQVQDLAKLKSALAEYKGNPFVLECPSVLATFWEPDLSVVYEKGSRTVSAIKHTLALDEEDDFSWLTSDTMDEHTYGLTERLVTTYHLETAEFIYDVLCGDKGKGEFGMLERRPNPARRPWYVLMPGNLTSEDLVEERYLPLVHAIYPLVQERNMLATLLNSGALLTGRNVYQLVNDKKQGALTAFEYLNQPAGERPVLEFDLATSAVLNPPEGYHYETLPTPDMRQVLEALQHVDRQIVEYGFPISLSSAPMEAKSGFDRRSMQEAAALLLTPALRARSSAWQELLALIGDISKEAGLAITIPVRKTAQGDPKTARETVTVKPDDWGEQDVTVDFTSMTPSERYPERSSNLELVAKQMMSRQTFLASEYPDWMAEDERIKQERDEAMTDQMVDQYVQAVLQGLAAGDVLSALQQLGIPAGQPTPPPPPGQEMNPAGGPPPGEDVRLERPPEGVQSGVGYTDAGVVPQMQDGVPVDAMSAGIQG